jgi:hypothetical protein
MGVSELPVAWPWSSLPMKIHAPVRMRSAVAAVSAAATRSDSSARNYWQI